MVSALPHVLKARYGASDYYTAGQVETAARQLKLGSGVLPYAVAVACSEDEAAAHGLERRTYFDLRDDVARLFWLDESRLHCRQLLFSFKNPVGKAIDLTHTGAGHGSGWH